MMNTFSSPMSNFSHGASGSEIPDGFEESSDVTEVVTVKVTSKERVIECLRDAGGDSLSAEEISEETGIEEQSVQKILQRLSKVGRMETREIFEDENMPGSFFFTEPLLDHLAVGYG